MCGDIPDSPDSPSPDSIARQGASLTPARLRSGSGCPGSFSVRACVDIVWEIPENCLIGIVRVYQKCLSPFLGNNCRFHPSCSQYFILAVRKYGAVCGAFRGVKRILRCHPWNPGGLDPP